MESIIFIVVAFIVIAEISKNSKKKHESSEEQATTTTQQTMFAGGRSNGNRTNTTSSNSLDDLFSAFNKVASSKDLGLTKTMKNASNGSNVSHGMSMNQSQAKVHTRMGTMEQELEKRRRVEDKRQKSEQHTANNLRNQEQNAKEDRDRKSMSDGATKERNKVQREAKEHEEAYVRKEQLRRQKVTDKSGVREDAGENFSVDKARNEQRNLIGQVEDLIVLGPVFDRDFISEGTDMINRISIQG